MRTFITSLVAALASASCADVGPFTCTEQAQCQVDEGGIAYHGFCNYDTGRCAWWDSSCPGGLVFDDSAGASAGTCVPGTCESGIIVSPPTEVACAASTRSCIETCETECDEDDECADECWGECIAGDADPDGCDGCVADTFVACANAAGCQAAWDSEECCFDQCDDPESPVCDSACAEATEDFDGCAAENDAGCDQMVIDTCFPPA